MTGERVSCSPVALCREREKPKARKMLALQSMQRSSDQNPFIIAHRGDSSHAPENTLAAFEMAFEKGADGVEFDVQMSRDGVPVVIHDHDLKRTGRQAGKVADFTAQELGTKDVGSWFNTRYPQGAEADFSSATVPTLTEVLRIAEKFIGPIYIELKCGDSDYDKLARAVCDQIRESTKLSQMIVKSFKLAAIPVVRSHLPEVQTASLFAPGIMTFLRRRKHLIALARELGAHQLSIHHSLATIKLCQLAAELPMPVTIWTADDAKWVDQCRRFGINALITNDPAKLLAVRDNILRKAEKPE